MVNYAWIQRISPTILTQIYIEAMGAKDEFDLLEGLSNSQYHLFPYLAIRVMEAAREGDKAACDVIQWTGEELGWLAVAVARQIGMQDEELEIIQSGSVFQAGELIMRPMRELVLQHCPGAKLIRLDGPPVVGAVILGMERVSFDGYAVRENMVRSSKELVQ